MPIDVIGDGVYYSPDHQVLRDAAGWTGHLGLPLTAAPGIGFVVCSLRMLAIAYGWGLPLPR